MTSSRSAPSVLRAAVVVLALYISVLRTAVLRVDGGEDGRSQREKSDSSELHYEYKIKNPFLEIGMSVSSNECQPTRREIRR